MRTIEGDLLELAEKGRFNMIIHGCNCFNTMGSGIAVQIAHRFPQAVQADNETKHGDPFKLGRISQAYVPIPPGHHLTIVNAYTQFGYGKDQRYLNYAAVGACFTHLARVYHEHRDDLLIGYPMIGAGLAGGDWDIISAIIDDALKGFNHTLVKYKS